MRKHEVEVWRSSHWLDIEAPTRETPVGGQRQSNILLSVRNVGQAMLAVSSRCVRVPRAFTQSKVQLQALCCSDTFRCADGRRFDLQRALHDLSVLPSGKPAIQYGPPGRSASTGQTATVFGCTSFLGRYLVAKLGMWSYLALLLAAVGWLREWVLTCIGARCSQGGDPCCHSLPRRG